MNTWDYPLSRGLEAFKELVDALIIIIHNEDERRQEKHQAEKRRDFRT